MATSLPLHLTRRTVLVGAAAVLAAGAGVPRVAGAAGTDSPHLRSATVLAGRLLALCSEGEFDSQYSIREFTVGADQAVELGERLAITLPEGFHPHSIAAAGDDLWITGAVDELVKTVAVDNRSDAVPERLRDRVDPDDADPDLPDGIVDIDIHRARPALVRVSGQSAEHVDLAVPGRIGSGAATGLTVLEGTGGRHTLAVILDGSPVTEGALVTRSHLAVSTDGGRNWSERLLADGLGEGYGTVLAAASGRLYAVTADGAGHQIVRVGSTDGELNIADDRPDAGRPMAAVATAEGGVRVFSERDGTVGEARYGQTRPESEAAECDCTGEAVAVAGLLDAWLDTDDDGIRANGTEQ